MEFTMIETGWLSILPPVIAIALALLTKEVYSSLFIGIVSGMLIYAFASGGTIISAAAMTFDMMSSKISDNSYMIIFLALLWAVVSLVSRSGGSQAYGKWVETRLKSKRAAAFATSLLGILIFIDDGFNCLTVGTVMRPITDRLRISREKLAYIIDATAAPVCIIAPVSSWAVAVASEVSATDGFHVFLSTIPYNFYALLTILMVIFISYSGKDFGPMKQAEEDALLKTPELAMRVMEAVRSATDLPVRLKLRLGWDEAHITAPELIRYAEALGFESVTLHGRTRAQMYGGAVNVGAIRAVAESVNIPVYANGGVTCAADALDFLWDTGAAGVAIGRAALKQPWIFEDIAKLHRGETIKLRLAPERIELLQRLAALACGHRPEPVAICEMRKFCGWMLPGHACPTSCLMWPAERGAVPCA